MPAHSKSSGTVCSVDPYLGRRAWRSLEAVHGMIYFTPHAQPAYEAVGVVGRGAARMGYFGSRAAAMGAVPAEVVMATFYNFNPELVRRSVPRVWGLASPDAILTARLHAVDVSLRSAFSDATLMSPDFNETVMLNRAAADVACERPEGRPLFAAHSQLAWPDEPHLALWHAQTLLREFRGDGHIAALVIEGLSGIEALISHAAAGDVPAAALMGTRAWSLDAWEVGSDELRRRGLIEPAGELAFTALGREQRQRIEDTTDRLAVSPYAALGERSCERLRDLGRPLSQAIVDAGLLTIDPARFLDD